MSTLNRTAKELLKAKSDAISRLVELDTKKIDLRKQIDVIDKDQRAAYEQAVSVGWSTKELSEIGIIKTPKKRAHASTQTADPVTHSASTGESQETQITQST